MLSSVKAFQWSDFEIVETLGEGHAGIVRLAKLKNSIGELPAEHLVAIKQYKTWVLEEAGQFERIIRELEVGRRIQHPNLVRTISVIRDSNGNPALVMEYYQGKTLEQYLQSKRDEDCSVDVEFAMRTAASIASALQALHSAGAIHRDVKPANIILSGNGPILMDLGVVKSRDFPEQTTRETFLGTIRYAAPEYLFAQDYDSSIDIYSLGAIIYEFFRGKQFLYDLYKQMTKHSSYKEINWARLVGLISQTEYMGYGIDYKAIQKQVGINVTMFVKFLMESTVIDKNHRTMDLEGLINLMNSRIWDEPFYEIENGLVPGYPPVRLIGRIGEWEDYPIVPFEEAMKDLLGLLIEEDKKLFHNLCEELLFTYLPQDFPDGTDIKSLINSGFVRYNKESKNYDMHPTIAAAYRYGYL